MSDVIDTVRKALTGWFDTKDEASGKGGDRREQKLRDIEDEAMSGTPNPSNQSSDASNKY